MTQVEFVPLTNRNGAPADGTTFRARGRRKLRTVLIEIGFVALCTLIFSAISTTAVYVIISALA
jgi:hypothetical protein